MQIESPAPERVREWLAQGGTGVSGRIEAELRAGTSPEWVLRGLQNHAAQLGEPGDPRALLTLDAIWDLLPVFGPEAAALLVPAARYLQGLKPRTLRPEWLERAPLADSPVVYSGSLDEVLEAKDLEAAGAAVARIRSVVQSEDYFHELLLEAAARHWEPPGWTLMGANAAVRALSVREWREGREILFVLLETLHRAAIRPLGALPPGEMGPLPFARAFWVAAQESRDLTAACLYLAHAFQAERTCTRRQRAVRHSLGSAMLAWFPGLADAPPAWEPRALSGDAVPIDPREGEKLAERMMTGDAGQAAEEAVRLLGEQPDPDPLFRWLSLPALPSLEAGNPLPLFLVNGARWGIHLLKGDRAPLLRRLVRELRAQAEKAGGGKPPSGVEG